MADIHITLPDDTITISSHTVDKLLRAADGDAALLYLHLLRSRSETTVKQSALATGRSENTVVAAMHLLSRLGIIGNVDGLKEAPPRPVPSEETPQYTAEDITRELENGSVFSTLVQEVQRSLNKILSSADLMRLFGIYDNLGLPPEVILQLVTHCIDEVRRKYSKDETRMPTMRYIEQAAYTWEREGIISLELAEQYLKKLESRRALSSRIKSVLQIRDREFSTSEKRYVEGWIDMGFSPEALAIAYDRTVLKTGKLSWAYMDSIIKSWHSNGMHTPAEIEERDPKKSTKTAPARQPGPRPAPIQSSAPTRDDLERIKRLMQKMKEGGENVT